MTNEMPRGYEIRIAGCADVDTAVDLQERLARMLCPVENHDGPCPVPWTFTITGDDVGPQDLLMLVWTTADTAATITAEVRKRVGGRQTVTAAPGEGEQFDVVAEQYRIEHEAG
ncbi:hypothetical protein AB0M36_11805 [Actinoplanes sp. NPDC051346]|uniref:hypothetical protein n=1 Tax=Actinoplanes sp. NPDC051346 TaxID=3155048 RepID=UPI0034237CB9